MTKSDLPKQDLISLREKLLAQINKQQEPTPKQKYDQAIYNRTMNPETMPAERLREFQSYGWFLGYEQRELTPEQAVIEEEKLSHVSSHLQVDNLLKTLQSDSLPYRDELLIQSIKSIMMKSQRVLNH